MLFLEMLFSLIEGDKISKFFLESTKNPKFVTFFFSIFSLSNGMITASFEVHFYAIFHDII